MLDQVAYRQRIGFTGQIGTQLETLQALHLAHATTIPFENLDIQMGLPIRLDLAALQDKLVRRRRGGYCFEQNTLFQAVLQSAGFKVLPCEARVRLGRMEVRARTHMLLLVELDGGFWLCDVGFGGEGLLHPVPLDGKAHPQFLNTYRIVPEGSLRVLQSLQGEAWVELYAFQPEARFPIDFEMANHYTSTHPDGGFLRTLTAQLPGPECRRVLRNRFYSEQRGTEVTTRELALDEVIPVLRNNFGLEVPEDFQWPMPL
jgi:N-hydroxyarylamine O-acetyltransferase